MAESIEQVREAKLRRFRPFPKYKDSGVEWLGQIPVHWEVNRVRSTVTSCQNGVWGDEPDTLHDIPCVRVADFDRLTFGVDISDPTLRSVEPTVVAKRALHSGDLLLEKSGGGENQPVGAVVLYGHPIPAVCSNFVARIIVADGNDPRFLTYLHAALYTARVNTRHIKQSTGIQNLDSSSYLTEQVGLPPDAEQRSVATFLDRETAKIDALVARKEQLIELLQEERTALITRAVTKGLDPNVPMKDSGVEWLGEIPAHWEVKRLKDVVQGITVGIVVTPSKYYVDEGVPCLRSFNIAQGTVRLTDLVFISPTANELHRKSKIFEGDVLVVRTGNAGTAAVVPRELDGANCIDLLIIRRSKQTDSRFLFHFINSLAASGQVEARSVGAIQDHYNTGTLAELWLPGIPASEQQAIADFLERETARIDTLIAKVREAIERLKEFRTALISAAVTGKIDVREETA